MEGFASIFGNYIRRCEFTAATPATDEPRHFVHAVRKTSTHGARGGRLPDLKPAMSGNRPEVVHQPSTRSEEQSGADTAAGTWSMVSAPEALQPYCAARNRGERTPAWSQECQRGLLKTTMSVLARFTVSRVVTTGFPIDTIVHRFLHVSAHNVHYATSEYQVLKMPRPCALPVTPQSFVARARTRSCASIMRFLVYFRMSSLVLRLSQTPHSIWRLSGSSSLPHRQSAIL